MWNTIISTGLVLCSDLEGLRQRDCFQTQVPGELVVNEIGFTLELLKAETSVWWDVRPRRADVGGREI